MSKKKSNRGIKPKRKPPWVLGGIVLFLFTFLLLLQPSNLWKIVTVESASDTLLLYALSSLNFIAFIIFAFILIRSLLKLRQERRSFQLGSKLKTKLLIYFAGVTILPLIAMAVFSYLFMNRALDRWFTQIPENVVREAGVLQNRSLKDQFNQTTQMLAVLLDGEDVDSQDLQRIVESGKLLHLEVVSEDGEKISASNQKINDADKKQLEKILSFIYSQSPDEKNASDGKGFYLERAKTSDGKELIAVLDMRSAENLSNVALDSLRQLDQLKSEQRIIRQLGLTTLALLTFLLIFAASWFAFYVAKGLTRPIRALAEGADEIAHGNFAHRVDVFAEDELKLLVDVFNDMSATLEENSAELQERRKYIETVLQSLSTGVISFDKENHVTTINKAAVQMLKLENADFTKIKLNRIVSKENNQILETLISRAKRIGQATEQTILQREFADGSAEIGENLPVAITATALPDENGVVIVIEDLTELITAQRATAWQEVARRMAHEIKNPLTPIQLSAERIAKRFSLANGIDENKELSPINSNNKRTSKIIKDGTNTILREVSSLKAMVDEFSRYARLPNVKLIEGNLNNVINQATLLYEDRQDEVNINTELSEDLPKLMIDTEQLKRVFVNLLDNAFESFEESAENKEILIKSYVDLARGIVVSEVSDNGKGIDPRNFQKLFQPYFSTKGRGTGLGLAIVQRIISEHNGKIKVVSNNPQGAKFIIELPL